MSTRLKAAILCVSGLLAACMHEGDEAALSARDYTDIRQLIDEYGYILDTCTNSGYDYADQYTETGTFGVSSEWGSAGYIWFSGREGLAEAAGGGKNGCRQRSGTIQHITTNPVIELSADGAIAKSTLLMLDSSAGKGPSVITWQGGYEDSFVKTSDGWRFQSRLHVWPGFDWPETAAEMVERRAKERAAAAEESADGE